MFRLLRPVICISLTFTIGLFSVGAAWAADVTAEWRGTRINDAKGQARDTTDRYPFRDNSAFILKEMDIRPGDAVVDIGAGDGWWSERIAAIVGENGTVHASEVKEELVKKMKEKYAGVPQLKPYLSPYDGTDLPENSCELAFFSQVFHHIEEDTKVDYLRHLTSVVKPTGRLMIIERYVEVITKKAGHGSQLSGLITQAEEAGWALVRYELMPKTYHYLAIFAQAEIFPPEPERKRQDRGRGRLNTNPDAPVKHTTDTVEQVKARLANGNAVLFDVREKSEWDAGHLKAASLLPLSEMRKAEADGKLSQEMKKRLPKDKIIYLHCRSGGRALAATELLRTLDYDIRPLSLGYQSLLDKEFEKAQTK